MKTSNQFLKTSVLFTFPFLIILGTYYFYNLNSFYILQNSGSDSSQTIPTYYYSDKIVQGNSEIQIIKNTKKDFSFQYILKEGALYHFAVACFSPGENKNYNLSGFDHVSLKIRARKGSRIPIHIISVQSSNVSASTYKRPSQFIVNVNHEWQMVQLPISEFYTPDWWYSQNKVKESDFGKSDFSKVVEISLGNCVNLETNIEDVVEVQELGFHKSMIPFFIFSGFIVLTYFLIILFFYFRKKPTTPKVTFDYQLKNNSSFFNKEEETIFNFISSNYYRAQFSIVEIQSTTGIPERKISQIIKNKTNLTFKQFLNKLRITEAKRLLMETDLQVSEIADKTGYSNVPHFNRVFKNLENYSPNDFRKNSKVKIEN
jgi:AraC-like DNA-binding protein